MILPGSGNYLQDRLEREMLREEVEERNEGRCESCKMSICICDDREGK